MTTEIVLTMNFHGGRAARHSCPGRWRARQYSVAEASAATTAAPHAAHTAKESATPASCRSGAKIPTSSP